MKQIKEKYINEIDIQKSKFIAVILPIYDKNSVKNEIDNLKKNYPKATPLLLWIYYKWNTKI